MRGRPPGPAPTDRPYGGGSALAPPRPPPRTARRATTPPDALVYLPVTLPVPNTWYPARIPDGRGYALPRPVRITLPAGGYPVRRTYAAATRPGCRLRGERSRCPSGHYPGPDFDLERQSRPRRSWHRWVRPPDSGGACSALRYDAGAGYFYATLPNRLLPCRCPAGAPQIYQPSCHYPAWIVASLPAPCRTRLDPALPFLTLPYAWLPCHVIPLTCKRTRRALGQR